MKVGPFDLKKDLLVIAEIGNNHEGDEGLAVEMIHQAAAVGADAVKFQTIVPALLVSAQQHARIEQLSRFQLSEAAFFRLHEAAEAAGVMFLSTPFDVDAVAFLDPLVPAFKVASGDNTFFPLLDAILDTGKPILLSTGLLNLQQCQQVKDYVYGGWVGRGMAQEMAMLHCVVSYPTAPAAANLRAITALQALGLTVGYSDHTLGIEAAVLAVALGARIIEKHFTLDNHYSDFRDHQLAADPPAFAEMVRRINEAVLYLGKGEKTIMPGEAAVMTAVRRSVVAREDLQAGVRLMADDLTWVRPGGGVPPGQESILMGKTLQVDKRAGEMIHPEEVAD